MDAAETAGTIGLTAVITAVLTKILDYLRIRGQQNHEDEKLKGEQKKDHDSVAVKILKEQLDRLTQVVLDQSAKLETLQKSEAACRAEQAAMKVQLEFLHRELQSLRPKKDVVTGMVTRMVEDSGMNVVPPETQP